MTQSSGRNRTWVTRFFDWFADVYEEIEQHWQPFIKRPRFVIRWSLLVGVPSILGAIFQSVVQDYYEDPSNGNIGSLLMKRAVFLGILILLFLLGVLLERRHEIGVVQRERLYQSLIWLYQTLGFDNSPEADIRCTIWVPIGKRNDNHEIRLQQAVDYYPALSRIDDQNYHVNGKAGRTFRVARKSNGKVKPVGMLGRVAIEAIRQQKFNIYLQKITPTAMASDAAFVSHMISHWNFPERQANRITLNRRIYMCLPMMDSSSTHLLGILYIDARTEDAFTKNTGKKAQKYLPQFAKLLTGEYQKEKTS